MSTISQQSLKKKLLVVNCLNRDNGTSASFSASIDASELNRVQRICLIGCSFTNSEYNINSKNNLLIYDVASLDGSGNPVTTTTTITITPGQYTIVTLLAFINAATSDFSVSLTATTNKLLLTRLAGVTITIHAVASTSTPVLGLANSTNLAFTTTANAPYLPDLSGLTMLYIESQAVGYSNCITAARGTRNIFTCIPVTAAFGEKNVFIDSSTDDNSSISYDVPQNIKSFNFNLIDSDLANVELNVQNDTILIFKVYYT